MLGGGMVVAVEVVVAAAAVVVVVVVGELVPGHLPPAFFMLPRVTLYTILLVDSCRDILD